VTRAYLDHASTSPARPEAVDAMLPLLRGTADPGRVHTEGRVARAAVEDARDQVAARFGARSREVIFTSGATEAINAAVFGATAARPDGVVVAAAVEHSAVRDASARSKVVEWPVDGVGRIVPADIPDDTALVHCQWANHEVATIQPVADVVARCREAGVLVHVDAAAAAGHVDIAFDELGADLLSISAHKFGGPAGIGALLVRRGLRLAPLLVGGEQERARRGGLENVPAIVGFGAACGAVDIAGEAKRNRAQIRAAIDAALAVEGVVVYGDRDDNGCVPHIGCIGVTGVEAEAVLLGLDQAGVAAHSGSACSSEALEPSPVLEAMGVDAERSVRVSVGWSTTDADIDTFLAAFPQVVARLRSLR
jgi:cysteine desulfurase